MTGTEKENTFALGKCSWKSSVTFLAHLSLLGITLICLFIVVCIIYRTLGIGGVTWFSPNTATSDFWGRDYFQEFLYHNMSSGSIVIQKQIEQMKELKLKETQKKDNRPLFFFLNIREMHAPYSAGIRQCVDDGNSVDFCFEIFARYI